MAAADNRRCIRNAPWRWYWRIKDLATDNALTGGLTGKDAEYSADGAAYTDLAGAETEIGTTGYGYTELTAAEMSFTNLRLRMVASNAGAVHDVIDVPFEPCIDSGVVVSATPGTVTLPATAPFSGTADIPNGGIFEVVRGTGAGQTRTITDCSTARVLDMDRNFTTNPDTTSIYIIHKAGGVKVGTDIVPRVDVQSIAQSAAAATYLAALYKFLWTGTVAASPSPTTSSFASTTIGTFADDFFNNMLVVFTSGDAVGLSEKVSDFTGSTGLFTLSDVIGAAPSAGATFCVLGKIK